MSAQHAPAQGLSLTDPRCAEVLNALPGLSPQQHTLGRLRAVRATYPGQFRDQRLSNLTNNSERREMKCWDVVNERGEVVRGGIIKGGNISWTSDRPTFPTRKAAQEWIEECEAAARPSKAERNAYFAEWERNVAKATRSAA